MKSNTWNLQVEMRVHEIRPLFQTKQTTKAWRIQEQKMEIQIKLSYLESRERIKRLSVQSAKKVATEM